MNTFDYQKIDEILDKHQRSKQAVIAILQDIQETYNYLPEELFPYVAQALGIGQARLYGVATFYADFSLEPKGKHIFRCCDGTACHVRKSRPILERLRSELALKEGATTTDDLQFTVETVSCLGACGLAPALTLDGEMHPNMTPDKAADLLHQLKKEEDHA